MCGIAGIIERQATAGWNLRRVSAMTNIIRHRGPDGDGVMELPFGVTLGHARLAIVDLSANAAQPMTSMSGGSTIVFNGEIYNFRELRRELQALGAKFRSDSDTEVLLHAYEEWGLGFVNKLNGMFAFALYDRRDGSVVLGRDRYGIKPLYYYETQERVVFGSEIKSVLLGRGSTACVDRVALAEYLAFQNNFSARTIVEGVKLFPAASVARVISSRVKPLTYWRAEICEKPNASKDSYNDRVEYVRTLLDKSIRSQLMGDVPVNCFLSGGVDSAAIASIAKRSVSDLKTFNCGFNLTGISTGELNFDESGPSRRLASALNTEHRELMLSKADYFALLDAWAWSAEEPRVGSTVPNFAISRLAASETKVCLSGTGGDELFGGYPWRYVRGSGKPGERRTELYSQYFRNWTRMLTSERYSSLLKGVVSPQDFDPYQVFSKRMEECESRVLKSSDSSLSACLIFEFDTFLRGLLLAEDKVSMAHGLEIRLPFLDNDLVDYVLTIPSECKVELGVGASVAPSTLYGQGGHEMPAFSNGKRILRDAVSHLVPKDISRGRKQGFSPPLESWYRSDFGGWLDGVVFPSKNSWSEHLDGEVLRTLWLEHKNGIANHRVFIAGIIALYLFHHNFLKKTWGNFEE